MGVWETPTKPDQDYIFGHPREPCYHAPMRVDQTCKVRILCRCFFTRSQPYRLSRLPNPLSVDAVVCSIAAIRCSQDEAELFQFEPILGLRLPQSSAGCEMASLLKAHPCSRFDTLSRVGLPFSNCRSRDRRFLYMDFLKWFLIILDFQIENSHIHGTS